MNNLYKLYQYGRRFADIFMLSMIAASLAFNLWLLHIYIERDNACTPLERELDIKVQVSELELRDHFEKMALRQRILAERPQTARIMAKNWRK